MQLLIEVLGRTLCYRPENCSSISVDLVKDFVCASQNVLPEYQILLCNGRQLEDDCLLDGSCDLIKVGFRLRGGKGGFGSLLRAQGSKRSGAETDNIDAMRDLSGRRMRVVNDEKKIKQWLEAQKEKEQNSDKKKQEKLERKMAVPKHTFDHHGLELKLEEQKSAVQESIKLGLKAAKVAPPEERVESHKKKPCIRDEWEDEISDSGASEAEETEPSDHVASSASASASGEASESNSPTDDTVASSAAPSSTLPTVKA